ncbi:ribosome silencing factor [Salinarimonas sp. NSM]|uniref:ribosome silencing factor n=1 Tax=Salinarimonas sp. NSM TaxID=3458003 RepID=UPI0040350211
MTLAQVSPREAETAPLPARPEVSASADGEILSVARTCLDDMKAEDVVEIDLVGKTSVADTMLVATGRSDRHVNAIADRIIQTLKDNRLGTPRVEGMPACDWVLIDAGDVIVHVFRPEVRSFYNLEKMWGADRPAERIDG